MLCQKCENRVVLDAFCKGCCEICGKETIGVVTPAPRLCVECAESSNCCEVCGEPLHTDQ